MKLKIGRNELTPMYRLCGFILSIVALYFTDQAYARSYLIGVSQTWWSVYTEPLTLWGGTLIMFFYSFITLEDQE